MSNFNNNDLDSAGTESGQSDLQIGGGLGGFLDSIFSDKSKNAKDITIELAKGNPYVAHYLIEKGTKPDFSFNDKHGRNAFHFMPMFAAHDALLKKTLMDSINKSNKKYLRQQDFEGNTPLHAAAQAGATAVCDKMLDLDPSLTKIKNNAGKRVVECDVEITVEEPTVYIAEAPNDVMKSTKDMLDSINKKPANTVDDTIGFDRNNLDDTVDLGNDRATAPVDVTGDGADINNALNDAFATGGSTQGLAQNSVQAPVPVSVPVSSLFAKDDSLSAKEHNDAGSDTQRFMDNVFNDMRGGAKRRSKYRRKVYFSESDQLVGGGALSATSYQNTSYNGPLSATSADGASFTGGNMNSATSNGPINLNSYASATSPMNIIHEGGFFNETSPNSDRSNNSEYSQDSVSFDVASDNSASSEFSYYAEQAGKATSEVHDRTLQAIKELLNTDDEVLVRSYKAVLYNKAKENNPGASPLDRANAMLAMVNQTEIDMVNKDEVDNLYQIITKRDKERSEERVKRQAEKDAKKKEQAEKKEKKEPKAKKETKAKKTPAKKTTAKKTTAKKTTAKKTTTKKTAAKKTTKKAAKKATKKAKTGGAYSTSSDSDDGYQLRNLGLSDTSY